MTLHYLFTGTGRCGTGYMAQVLNGLGLPCGHEAIFNMGQTDVVRDRLRTSKAVAESSWLAVPYLDWPELRGVTVVQVMRHPKKVMDSLLRMGFFADRFMSYHNWARAHVLPELDNWNRPEDKAALWWLGVNGMVAERADLMHRIEEPVTRILGALGIDYYGKELFGDTRYNHRAGRGPSDVRLVDISEPLRYQIREVGKLYGYEWEE